MNGMDFDLSGEQALLRKTVRDFAEKELAPHSREWDEKQAFPREIFSRLGEVGLAGCCWPEEYGGSGLSTLDWAVVMEELARVDAGVALSLAAHHGLCSAHIHLAGDEEQKRRLLPPLARGEKVGCWGLTEPGSGSDAGGMRTTAVRDGNGWVLNGSKTFITNGRIADTAVVMAVTDRAAGKKGISALVVQRGTPGFRAGKKEDKLGVRSSDTSELAFEDCRVPAGNLLGREGMGFVDTLKILDKGRVGIAAFSVGIAQAALEASIRYARERRQFGHPIADFQAIQFKIAEMATKTEAARLLTWRAAALADAGRPHTAESSMAKLFASEAAVEAALEAVQVHGGYGYLKDYPVERYLRDAKIGTIGEGTSEVQRLVIARQLLHLRPVVR
ncbi:MAG TPA: acyl-CoA dehydrogenase family protein [Vicinamibacteria bacterium]|nr:acyl-CoA dehydrogenase family protein [Vicinamibacteria bacterium]